MSPWGDRGGKTQRHLATVSVRNAGYTSACPGGLGGRSPRQFSEQLVDQQSRILDGSVSAAILDATSGGAAPTFFFNFLAEKADNSEFTKAIIYLGD